MYSADAIVVETNQGGDMVKQTIQSARPGVPVIEVHASRGKVTRAEPIAALYEQGRISHVGAHAALEDQMVLFTPLGIAGETTGDRVDALVWGLSQLFPSIIRKVETDWSEQFASEFSGSGAWMGA
jgi:phage terminase large subunit-like protein